MRTHCLIFGSTGSGKTETLLSISYNALVQGRALFMLMVRVIILFLLKYFLWLDPWGERMIYWL